MPNMYTHTLWTSLVYRACLLVANYYCIFVCKCVCLSERVSVFVNFYLISFYFCKSILICVVCFLWRWPWHEVVVAAIFRTKFASNMDIPIYKCSSGISLSSRYINALVEFGVIIHTCEYSKWSSNKRIVRVCVRAQTSPKCVKWIAAKSIEPI